MKKNVSTADKVIRTIIAIVIIILFYLQVITGTLGLVLLAVAGILFLTAIAGFCPLYRILGIASCKVDTPAKK